jgi:hypothetical protein
VKPTIDSLIEQSLAALAADKHVQGWLAKEHDWVSYFAMQHLIPHCHPDGVLAYPAQIAIEGSVAQPPGYAKSAVRRDLVIWPSVGMTCWSGEQWIPSRHPLAIMEFKVHRPRARNRQVDHEREWLRKYCALNPTVLAYAVTIDGSKQPTTITCDRFLGSDEQSNWLKYRCE